MFIDTQYVPIKLHSHIINEIHFVWNTLIIPIQNIKSQPQFWNYHHGPAWVELAYYVRFSCTGCCLGESFWELYSTPLCSLCSGKSWQMLQVTASHIWRSSNLFSACPCRACILLLQQFHYWDLLLDHLFFSHHYLHTTTLLSRGMWPLPMR